MNQKVSANDYRNFLGRAKALMLEHEKMKKGIHLGLLKAATENEQNLMGFLIGTRRLIDLLQGCEFREKKEEECNSFKNLGKEIF